MVIWLSIHCCLSLLLFDPSLHVSSTERKPEQLLWPKELLSCWSVSSPALLWTYQKLLDWVRFPTLTVLPKSGTVKKRATCTKMLLVVSQLFLSFLVICHINVGFVSEPQNFLMFGPSVDDNQVNDKILNDQFCQVTRGQPKNSILPLWRKKSSLLTGIQVKKRAQWGTRHTPSHISQCFMWVRLFELRVVKLCAQTVSQQGSLKAHPSVVCTAVFPPEREIGQV